MYIKQSIRWTLHLLQSYLSQPTHDWKTKAEKIFSNVKRMQCIVQCVDIVQYSLTELQVNWTKESKHNTAISQTVQTNNVAKTPTPSPHTQSTCAHVYIIMRTHTDRHTHHKAHTLYTCALWCVITYMRTYAHTQIQTNTDIYHTHTYTNRHTYPHTHTSTTTEP